ncbi:MAG TPA: hypothetical protein PLO05_10085 [Bacteroidales bacterium]|nr:hypothetical protein [Bacteroidales bacterium]HXK82496.1 hypothetical protein [Bacteroidales bacterium]
METILNLYSVFVKVLDILENSVNDKTVVGDITAIGACDIINVTV